MKKMAEFKRAMDEAKRIVIYNVNLNHMIIN